ncbi:MAG: response regulator transcription factor [Candidatus Planktophila sp.]
MKRIEDFASYLLGNPSDLQEILTNLHYKVLGEDNAVYVALTEKTPEDELYILGSSGLDQDSLVGLSWLRTTTQFPTIDCLNSSKEVYLPSKEAWLEQYPQSALFREKLGIEEIICQPIHWNDGSHFCLSLAFGSSNSGRHRDLESLRTLARLFQTYLENTRERKVVTLEPPKSSMKRKIETLSARHQETVTLVVKGLNNQQIAEELGISVNTVKADLKKIFKELGVSYRSQIYAEMIDED